MDAPLPTDSASDDGTFRLLVIGGYGTFGGRLIELLANTPDLTILVAGRSLRKAGAFCDRVAVAGGANLVPVALDRTSELSDELERLRPDLLVDASGPFQNYGDDGYRVIEAALAARVHYLDLADGSDFVAGVDAFDARARKAGIFVLSGASSFPALTGAVLRELTRHVPIPSTMTAGVAPSPYAEISRNVIRAIASYSGQKISLRRDGEMQTAHALTESLRYTISVAGHRPLKPRRFSLVDVPDLRIVPTLRPEIKTVWVGAGTVPETLHRVLNGLAWLVRWRLVPTLAPLAGVMHLAMNALRLGAHRGGLFVRIKGRDASGTLKTATWHLIVEGDDGPYIPSMAAEAVVRRCLEENAPPAGARPAHGDIELEVFERLFKTRAISTETHVSDDLETTLPLYQRHLRSAWNDLPKPLRQLHAVRSRHRFVGTADVVGAQGAVAKVVARVVGFPGSASQIPVNVVLEADGVRETWSRNFDGQKFHSTQEIGRGRCDGLIVERFGVFCFGLAVLVRDETLSLEMERWSLFGVPLPLFLAPKCDATETSHDGKFRFSVRITAPLIGMLVHYSGVLEPVDEGAGVGL